MATFTKTVNTYLLPQQWRKYLNSAFIYGLTFLIGALLLSSQSIGQVAPVNPPAVGFNINGGLQANTSAGDWVDGSGTGGFVLNNDGTAVNGTTTGLKQDLYNSGSDNIFSEGSKFNMYISDLNWTSSSAPNKNDINNGMYHVSTDPNTGNQWAFIGGDRYTQDGQSYIDFEFLQNTVSRNTNANTFTGAGPAGGRTVGDLVISMYYVNGGSTANVYFYKWQSIGGNKFGFVEFTPPANTAYAQTNGSAVTVPFGAFGSTTYATNAFVEGGINITQLLTATGGACAGLSIKTLWIKTKASSSLTAALKDFIDPIPVSFTFGTASIDYADPFCKGPGTANVTLTGTTGGTYTASPAGLSINSTTGAIDLNLSNAGTYTVTYSFNAGGSCNQTATTQVVINAPPTITGTLSVCVNGTTQLTGSGTAASSNPWVSSNTAVATVSATGLVTGISAGTAIITYTNSLGCSNTATVTVNALPTITGTLSVCVDATTQLTGSPTAASSNPWVSSNTAVATVSVTGLVTGKSAGSAIITYTNSNGCQTTATVTVNALPTASAGTNPAAQCYVASGNTFNLSGTGTNGDPSWSVINNPAGLTVTFNPNPPNTLSPQVTLSGKTSGGTVTLRLTVTGTCGSNTDDIDLTVSQQVQGPSVTMLPVICTDKTFSLQVDNPQNGTKYTLTQPGNTNDPIEITYTGSGDVIFSGLIFGDGGSVIASQGSCSSAPGSCEPVALKQAITKAQLAQPKLQVVSEKTMVTAAPNPFTDKVRFTITPATSGRGTLDLYNMLGQKVKTVFQGQVQKGQVQTIEYYVPGSQRNMLIYQFNVGKEHISGKLLGLK
jgi:hypothetical protein